MGVGQVRDQGLTWTHDDSLRGTAHVENDIFVAQLDTLGVPCCTRCVTENVYIVLRRHFEGDISCC